MDGSRVLTHMLPENSYTSAAVPQMAIYGEYHNTDKDVCPEGLMLYGLGDGGGGPGEGHLEYMMRHKKNIDGLAPCKPSFAVKFFEDIKDMADKLPTHSGELYYERHQGCYTSQANAKKWNRRIEELLHTVEWLGAVAYFKDVKYDRAKVEKIWKEVLLYQFHDVLPGSSIKRVYDEAYARYQILYDELKEIQSTLLDALGTGLPSAQ